MEVAGHEVSVMQLNVEHGLREERTADPPETKSETNPIAKSIGEAKRSFRA